MHSESTPSCEKSRSALRCLIPPPLKFRVWLTKKKAVCSELIVNSDCNAHASTRFDYWAKQAGCLVTFCAYSESTRRYIVTAVAQERIEDRYTITPKGRAALMAAGAQDDEWYYNGRDGDAKG